MTTGFDDFLRRIEQIKNEAAQAERERILKKFHAIHDQHHQEKDFCWVCDAQFVITNGEPK